MKKTWRLVLEIVGMSLALAGLLCVLIGYWDRLVEGAAALKDACCGRRCSEFDDYDDDFLCQ